MTRLLNGLSAQLLLVTILPLALIVVGVAFGGVYAHREAMRMLVSERDMRAVMATANMLEHTVMLRADHSPDISAGGFDRLINPMADQWPMTAFLFDDAGIALLHTNRALAGASVIAHGGVREALRGDHGVAYVTDGASTVEHVVSYTPIQLGGRRFGLVMEEPWQDMVSPLMTYSQITPMVVMPLLLLIAIGLLLGMRCIVRPLRQLRLQARLAAAGDLTALAQPVNGIEEIEELQHTLKSLADQVTRDQDRQPAGRQRTSS